MDVIYKHGVGKHFDILSYPDGQQSVQLDMQYFNNPKEPVTIRCSVRNFVELEVLLCLKAALEKHDFYISTFDFKYLFGLRSDRAFTHGQPNYVRDVLRPIIDRLTISAKHSMILSPHSLVAARHLSLTPYLKSLDTYNGSVEVAGDQSFDNNNFHWSEHYGFHKKRNDDGTIDVSLDKKTKEWIESHPDYLPVLITDDLCDGGGTFVAIGEYMKEHYPNRRLELFVQHGLFTKGVDYLFDYYQKIYTTNSYQEFEPRETRENLVVVDVWKQD